MVAIIFKFNRDAVIEVLPKVKMHYTDLEFVVDQFRGTWLTIIFGNFENVPNNKGQ